MLWSGKNSGCAVFIKYTHVKLNGVGFFLNLHSRGQRILELVTETRWVTQTRWTSETGPVKKILWLVNDTGPVNEDKRDIWTDWRIDGSDRSEWRIFGTKTLAQSVPDSYNGTCSWTLHPYYKYVDHLSFHLKFFSDLVIFHKPVLGGGIALCFQLVVQPCCRSP